MMEFLVMAYLSVAVIQLCLWLTRTELRADWRRYALDDADAERLHRHLNNEDDDNV